PHQAPFAVQAAQEIVPRRRDRPAALLAGGVVSINHQAKVVFRVVMYTSRRYRCMVISIARGWEGPRARLPHPRRHRASSSRTASIGGVRRAMGLPAGNHRFEVVPISAHAALLTSNC